MGAQGERRLSTAARAELRSLKTIAVRTRNGVRTLVAILRTRKRARLLLAATLVVGVAATAAGLLWPTEPSQSPDRERHYKTTTACLLTDDKGLNGDVAKAAWAGMQDASLATLIKVQHLAVNGPQTAANGLTYFNTLGVRKCTVIIAVGDAPVAAMADGYPQFPHTRHVAIGGDTRGRPLTTVDTSSPATIQSQVREIVAQAA